MKINGTLCGFFKGKKGLRQGDPISPYIFSIAMNVLSSMLAKIPLGFKFHWKCKDLRLTHLFYADDVLLFSKGDVTSVNHLMNCIAKFSAVSGLRPSLSKSNAFFGNCSDSFVQWFDTSFGIAHGDLPVRFLGVPLISSKLSYNDCVPLLEKITTRISFWCAHLLSLAGRVQLIISFIFAIQTFWSNHFMLPCSVHLRLQTLCTRFLWKGDVNAKGGAKVSWETICRPKVEGGLGLKNGREWNQAQMLLHLCKVAYGSKSL